VKNIIDLIIITETNYAFNKHQLILMVILLVE